MPRFKKGQSGNPAGRPKGIPDKRAQLRAGLEAHADELIAKCAEMALAGDPTALRLSMERIAPALKSREEPIQVDLTAETASGLVAALVEAVSKGEVTPGEASRLAQLANAQLRAREFDELEDRIKKLEEKSNAA